MGRPWVLDTETKGTGAEMRPLDRVESQRERAAEPIVVRPKVARPKPPKAREPRHFRVIDVLSGEVLCEDADARATVELLGGVRSIVDVAVSEWDTDHERWRPLTFGERRTLWARRRPSHH